MSTVDKLPRSTQVREMRSAQVREIVIEDLGDENLLLRERIASLEADRDAYRLLAQQALHRLAQVTTRAAATILDLEDDMIRPPEDPTTRAVDRDHRLRRTRAALHRPDDRPQQAVA